MPFCYDALRVMPDYGLTYRWDMNGLSIDVGSVTGTLEPLDAEFEAWAAIYDAEFPDPCPFDNEPAAASRFDASGLELARKLHVRFSGTKTIRFVPLVGRAHRAPWSPKPSMNLQIRQPRSCRPSSSSRLGAPSPVGALARGRAAPLSPRKLETLTNFSIAQLRVGRHCWRRQTRAGSVL